ncbi:MAG: copper chaperone Copz family protein [Acidobacteria bacterium]|nr:copper chaperone Copz family protein [Acidobacteriota bacterium]MBI3663906.1 copper chaperone Copz family protein [Acidobacteriota bacterium]
MNKPRSEVPAVMACPVCGTRSKQVDTLTVKSLVRHLRFGAPPTQYYFCDAAGCDVVYFPLDPAAPTFRRADLWVRVGVKELEDSSLVCYCFGVTRGNIRDEIQRTGKSSMAERIKAEVKAGHCACETKNPSGKCCLGSVTREARLALQSAPTTIERT